MAPRWDIYRVGCKQTWWANDHHIKLESPLQRVRPQLILDTFEADSSVNGSFEFGTPLCGCGHRLQHYVQEIGVGQHPFLGTCFGFLRDSILLRLPVETFDVEIYSDLFKSLSPWKILSLCKSVWICANLCESVRQIRFIHGSWDSLTKFSLYGYETFNPKKFFFWVRTEVLKSAF